MPKFPRLNRQTASRFKEAMDRVAPDARPAWGSLDAPRMMAHLARSIDISMGRIEVPPMGNWLMRRPFFKRLIFEFLPWPKAKIKAPAEFFVDASDFETERANAGRSVDEFVAMLEADPSRTVVSAAFGPVELSYWAVIHGRHIQWHLRQFGVELSA